MKKIRFEVIDQSSGELWFAGHSVTRDDPCPICGKPTTKREGYCCIDHERGLVWCGHSTGQAFFRVGFGRVSLHCPPPKTTQRVVENPPDIDWDAMIGPMQAALDAAKLALKLGVSPESIRRLGAGWHAPKASSAWPMRDAQGSIIGIRLRTKDGSRKFAVTGSRNGLFFDLNQNWTGGPVMVVEGPTDTAAMLSVGLAAVGRAGARTNRDSLSELLAGLDVVVCAETDQDGQAWARVMADAISRTAKSTRLITPLRGKDVRQWITEYGAGRDTILDVVCNTKEHRRG